VLLRAGWSKMCQCRHSLAAKALFHIGLLICLLAVTPVNATTLFRRREATPQLPLEDTRLRRNGEAHEPEQVN
jgi:hypothetical protein